MVTSPSRTSLLGSPEENSVTDDATGSTARATISGSWRMPLKSLLRADSAVQLGSYRSLILGFALPLFILIVTHLGRTSRLGGPDVRVELALTVGLVSIGTMGYSLAMARDRDRGVLQRLRVTPAPTWTIMVSRWTVQLAAILGMTVFVLLVAGIAYGLTLSAGGYVLTVVVVLPGSAVFLSIGQVIAGLFPSAETLNSAGRLLYMPLIFLSVFGQSDILGTAFELVARWSPGGCLETLLSAAMGASSWNGQAWGALLASAAYTIVFAGIGIRWFRWTGK